MGVIVILIGCSLLVAMGFFAAFLWAVRQGQFEDASTPAIRMLFEPEKPEPDTHADRNLPLR